jgi:CRISPR-associated protein Cas2
MDRVSGGYKAMWLFALFDLPVKTKAQRKRYTKFRKFLLNEGFTMLQFSVYAKYCASEESANTHRTHIKGNLPNDGQVRVIGITDRQFGKMEIYFGKKRAKVEDPPLQMTFW